MPYKQVWDPNITEVCPRLEVVTEWPKGSDHPVQRTVPCSQCSGTGSRRVGGYRSVWVEPEAPR